MDKEHIAYMIQDSESSILTVGSNNNAIDRQLYKCTDNNKIYIGLSDGTLSLLTHQDTMSSTNLEVGEITDTENLIGGGNQPLQDLLDELSDAANLVTAVPTNQIVFGGSSGELDSDGGFEYNGELKLPTNQDNSLNKILVQDNSNIVHSREVSSLPFGNRIISKYNPSDGYLIETDIPATTNVQFVGHIRGDSYGQKEIININFQGYNYNSGDAIINTEAEATSYNDAVHMFNYNGYVYFWIDRTVSNFSSLYAEVFSTNKLDNTNRVVSITDSSMPTSGVTREVVVTPTKIWTEKNLGDAAGTGLSYNNNQLEVDNPFNPSNYDNYNKWKIGTSTFHDIASGERVKVTSGDNINASVSQDGNGAVLDIGLNGSHLAGTGLSFDGNGVLNIDNPFSGNADNYQRWVAKVGSNTENITTGEVLEFEGGSNINLNFNNGKITIASTSSVSSIDDLNDVNAPSPSSGDILVWTGSEFSSQSGSSYETSGDDNEILVGTGTGTNTYDDFKWIDAASDPTTPSSGMKAINSYIQVKTEEPSPSQTYSGGTTYFNYVDSYAGNTGPITFQLGSLIDAVANDLDSLGAMDNEGKFLVEIDLMRTFNDSDTNLKVEKYTHVLKRTSTGNWISLTSNTPDVIKSGSGYSNLTLINAGGKVVVKIPSSSNSGETDTESFEAYFKVTYLSKNN